MRLGVNIFVVQVELVLGSGLEGPTEGGFVAFVYGGAAAGGG